MNTKKKGRRRNNYEPNCPCHRRRSRQPCKGVWNFFDYIYICNENATTPIEKICLEFFFFDLYQSLLTTRPEAIEAREAVVPRATMATQTPVKGHPSAGGDLINCVH